MVNQMLGKGSFKMWGEKKKCGERSNVTGQLNVAAIKILRRTFKST